MVSLLPQVWLFLINFTQNNNFLPGEITSTDADSHSHNCQTTQNQHNR